ncbi:MAG: low molecular weight phosphatase family protein [Dehalococcoidia bacterium]
MKVLFVCVANASRSQVAQALFDQLSSHQSNHQSESAGTRADEIVRSSGLPSPRLKDGPRQWSVEYLKQQGMDISENLRKQLTPEMVERADKVIVMAEGHTWPEFLSNSDKVTVWDSPDPAELPEGVPVAFAVFDRIKQRVEQLVQEIG